MIAGKEAAVSIDNPPISQTSFCLAPWGQQLAPPSPMGVVSEVHRPSWGQGVKAADGSPFIAPESKALARGKRGRLAWEQINAGAQTSKTRAKETRQALLISLALVIFVGVYVVLGSIGFKAFERDAELRRLSKGKSDLASARLSRASTELFVLGLTHETPNETWPAMEEAIDAWHRAEAESIVTHRFYGEILPALRPHWTFVGSVLFVVTTLTCIGYGLLAPITTGGRMMVLWYGVLGIPLMLILLMRVGAHVDELLCWAWRSVCLRPCDRRREDQHIRHHDGDPTNPPRTGSVNSRDRRVPVALHVLVTLAWLFGGLGVFVAYEGWTFCQALYFVFTSTLTIGFGDLLPGKYKFNTTAQSEQLAVLTVFLVIGLALMAALTSSISGALSSAAARTQSAVTGQEEQEEENRKAIEDPVIDDWEERAQKLKGPSAQRRRSLATYDPGAKPPSAPHMASPETDVGPMSQRPLVSI